MTGVNGPISRWLLLLAYPAWFRDEFRADLVGYLARQRAEPRYRGRVVGAARFWWHAGGDSLATGLALRLGRERLHWPVIPRGQRKGLHEPFPGKNLHGQRMREAGTMLDAVRRDVRDAMRGLTRNPGYAAVFILTLSLGIGANTAMFSAVNGVLLRALPHEDGDRCAHFVGWMHPPSW